MPARTAWNARVFPYPLLMPGNGDYPANPVFEADIHDERNNGATLNFTLKYRLESPCLKELIKAGKAQYLTTLDCISTKRRDTVKGCQPEQHCALDATLYENELTVTNLIVTTSPLENFISDEHNPEFQLVNPAGFSLSPGNILAVGHEHRMELSPNASPHSVIDIVADSHMEETNPPQTDTSGERVVIRLPLRMHERTNAIRRHRNNPRHPHMAGLFTALYVPALAQAITDLNHSDSRWTRSLRSLLDSKGITEDQAKESPTYYAQALMDNPAGRFVEACSEDTEEP